MDRVLVLGPRSETPPDPSGISSPSPSSYTGTIGGGPKNESDAGRNYMVNRETKFAHPVSVLLLLLLAFCYGCGSKSENLGPGNPAGRPLGENLKEVVELSKELQFCLSEEAGTNTLQNIANRMVSVLDALPDAVEAADLSATDKSKLADSIEEMRDACNTSGMDSDSAFRDLDKALRKPLRDLAKFLAK